VPTAASDRAHLDAAPPRATLRLQFHAGFRFDDALPWIPYFAALGISHVYASPILCARAGSMHGYDGVDPRQVSAALGGEDGLRRLVSALRAHGLGLIVDIVPNHMAVGAQNPWWMDLLEWGRDSRYAGYFDIDWEVPDAALQQRLLAPFLGKPCGVAIDDGELALGFDGEHGRLHIAYFDQRFPLAARDYAPLLQLHGDATAAFAAHFREALRRRRGARFDAFERACAALAQAAQAPAVAAALQGLCARYAPHSAEGRERLDRLLEHQHYRLAWWRTAADEINWRRFFDISELVGLRAQDPAVFDATHATLLRLYAEGLVDGLRVDHVDGLADPRSYCRQLRARTQLLAPQRPPPLAQGRAYLVVEKILAPGEKLPRDWQMDGTSGYVFMDQVSALLHDPAGEQPLTELWQRLSGRSADFHAEARRARRRLAEELFAADVSACARVLQQVARLHARTRDWSLAAIRRVLLEILVAFPVYRSYADARGRSADDAAVMATALAQARAHCRPSERPLLELIDAWLGGEPARLYSGPARRARLRALARFQQLTSPLAAKSVEDTAFYRHGRMLSRNEVGADPDQFAMAPQDFHAACRERRRRYPLAMLATATHDHKRGEDLRARLAVLSECPQDWQAQVNHWRERHAALKQADAPDSADEAILYQMLAGAWPPRLDPADAAGLAALRERIGAWQVKALREAKRRSDWRDPDERYEAGCTAFVARLLDPAAAFARELAQFVAHIGAAGAVNGLAQTLLRMTTPGLPDLYQGAEFWDFGLVDPDNRRPVDFCARAAALAQPAPLATLLRGWRDGRIKQRLIARTLALRAQWPALFAEGDYQALTVRGRRAANLLAFVREHRGVHVLVAVPRLPLALGVERQDLSLAAAEWGDTVLVLPPALQRLAWSDQLADEPAARAVGLGRPDVLLQSAPVALWRAQGRP